MSGNTNAIGLVINSSNPLSTLNGGIGRSVTPTSGSVLFYDSTGVQQNNANLFWDNSNNRLGINTNSFDFLGVDFQITNNSLAGSSAVIRTSITGSTNQAALYLCRGDQANGGALLRFFTGIAGSGTSNWDIGTAAGSTNLVLSSGINTWLTLSNSGVMNLSQLTASQAVATDGSKNLISLAYSSSNTASTLVERDSSGNFSAGTITATLSGNATSATTATTATNANNVATTLVTTNASYFPIMVSSSSNSNQAVDLSSGITFNPNTNTLNTNVVQASNSLQVGTTTNNAPLTVQGSGGTTGSTALIASFTSSASPTAANLFIIDINKSGTESLLMGVNKNTVTGGLAANRAFISSYVSNSGFSIGRGDGTGLPSTTDIGIDGSGNITINNGYLDLTKAGNGLRVAEGTNAKQGTSTLATGTVTVSNTSVTATSRIFLTAQNSSGTAGSLYISARTAGTSFTITSTSTLDTRLVAWEIFEVG